MTGGVISSACRVVGSRRKLLERIVGFALMVAVLLVYAQVARHDFITFDDGAYVTSNARVQAGLSRKGLLWAFSSTEVSNWHPLTWISHMLDCELYGLNPAGHHLSSLFFHMANSLLLFLLLREGTGRLWESAMVAGLFGLHPVHVESVAWISERKDVLSGFFWMLTMLFYIRYARNPRTGRYLLVLVTFGIGLMAKPMLVTLPLVLFLLDLWPLGRLNQAPHRRPRPKASSKMLLMEKVPLLALSAASCLVTFVAQSKGGALSSFETISLRIRIINALVAYAKYLGKMFWPRDLAIFYPHPVNSLPLWQGIAAGLLILGITVVVLKAGLRKPFFQVGWFWFLGTLVPVIGIVQVGGQSMADRYTYLPSIGVFIMVVWGLSFLLAGTPSRRALLGLGSLGLLLALSVVTRSQLGYWKNSETVFQHAISVTTRNYVAYSNLGMAFMRQGRLDEAAEKYRKALEIWPSYSDAHNNLGVVLEKKDLMESAMEQYEAALKANPRHILAHMNLAGLFMKQGMLNEAIGQYSAILNTAPDYMSAHNALGVILAKQGDVEGGISHLRHAMDLCPECPEVYNNLGRVLTMAGDTEGAIARLKQAIRLKGDYAEAYNNLGLAYERLGELEEALFYFISALHHRPHYAKARSNLRRVILSLSENLKGKRRHFFWP